MTSKPYADSAAVVLKAADFERGSLHVTGYARPGKLFTASGDLVENVVGALRPESVREFSPRLSRSSVVPTDSE